MRHLLCLLTILCSFFLICVASDSEVILDPDPTEQFIVDHLTMEFPDQNLSARWWITLETILYKDAIERRRDWDISDFADELVTLSPIAFPADDFNFIKAEDLHELEGRWQVIVVSDGENITLHSLVYRDEEELASHEINRGIYEEARELGVDIQVLYFMRIMTSGFLTGQSVCDVINEGVIDDSWFYEIQPHSFFVINPEYAELIENLDLECDDLNTEWTMTGPNGPARYCVNAYSQASSILGIWAQRNPNPDRSIEEILRDAECDTINGNET